MLGQWGSLVSRVFLVHAAGRGERHFLYLRSLFVG